MNLVNLENVSKIYKTGEIEIKALNNVNINIKRGSYVSVIGPSGSGKSTLLNLIGCLNKPTTGNIFFDGKPLNSLNRKKSAEFRGDHLGFIFQDFNLIPVLSVYENIEYPLIMVKNVSKNERRKLILELLESVEMSDQKDKRPNQISGGQKQRVSIARALVTQPELVLADEPTANLDHKTAFKVLSIMKKMNKNYNVTFIFSTHDPKVVESAEIVYTLEDGRIVSKEER